MKRVVVITGGAGGIGQACVNLFAKEDIVVVLDVNQANVRQWIDRHNRPESIPLVYIKSCLQNGEFIIGIESNEH